MKIVAVGGSLRPHSYTYRILRLALHQLEAQNIPNELIDLRQLNIPFCTGESHYPLFPDVEHFRQIIKSATGIMLATPEYHGSISGALKNALDLLQEEHMAGKVVGLIAVVGGVHSTNAVNTLRLICRQLHCWVLPEQIIIPYAEESFDAQGLIDPSLQKRLNAMVERLVITSKKLYRSVS